jgi:hypothetical protein
VTRPNAAHGPKYLPVSPTETVVTRCCGMALGVSGPWPTNYGPIPSLPISRGLMSGALAAVDVEDLAGDKRRVF